MADIREEEGGVVRVEAAGHNLVGAREIGLNLGVLVQQVGQKSTLAFVVVIDAFGADEY